MSKFFRHIIIIFLGLTITLDPLVVLMPQKIQAADEVDTEVGLAAGTPLIYIARNKQKSASYTPGTPGASCPVTAPPSETPKNDLLELLAKYDNSNSANLTFNDLFSDNQAPKIVLNQSDANAVRGMLCLTKIVPNYNEDYTALHNMLSREQRNSVNQAVTKEAQSASPRFKNEQEYYEFLRFGLPDQTEIERLDNENKFNTLVEQAKKNYTDNTLKKDWQEKIELITQGKDTGIDTSALTCITGLTLDALRAKLVSDDIQDHDYVANRIKDTINSLNIDIRVLNLLVYLVTPKDQGGAGHWRIRVARLLQEPEKSNESDAMIEAEKKNLPTLTAASANNSPNRVDCDETMTAAECGSQQDAGQAVVEDEDGTEYEAFFQDMDKEFDDERNISAHKSGQAVDISEVDDIRCTLIQKKRIGKWTKKQQPIRPIKLLWQTTDGWNKSGDANSLDMMGMMENLARQNIVDLLTSVNGDISDYEGDLSRANFTDLVGILGQSLLAGAVSTGPNFSGVDFTGTIKNIGAMYFADYFDLPREILVNVDLTDVENLKYVIGRSAVEKKLGVPYGTLDNLNLAASFASDNDKPTHDLTGLVMNVGQRKVERELGLESHDLDRYFEASDGAPIDDKTLGRIVLENELNLPKGQWPEEAVSYNDLDSHLSLIRKSALRVEPGHFDTLLDLDPGTMSSFISGAITSEQLAEKVGASRFVNTSAGLKYFVMNNSAYQLPGPTAENPNTPDTWTEAISGDPEAVKTVGIYTLARLLGENSADLNIKSLARGTIPDKATVESALISSADGTETSVPYDRTTYGQFIFRNWLQQNLTIRINADDGCAAVPADDNPINIVYNGATLYNGPADLSRPTQADVDNTVSAICPLNTEVRVESLTYRDDSGTHTIKADSIPPGLLNVKEKISEESALAAGLEKSDLYSIMGYSQADGRGVFSRIGAKLLYYGITNKALSPEERAAIDLTDTNPSLNISDHNSSIITFYLSRVTRAVALAEEIKEDSTVLANDVEAQASGITTRVERISSTVSTIFENTDLDLTKISKIAKTALTVKNEAMVLKDDFVYLNERYGGLKSTEARKKIDEVNAIIFKVNELILTVTEILAGKNIDSTDAISLNAIKQATNDSDDGGGDDKLSSLLNKYDDVLQVYLLISRQITPDEFLTRVGSGQAEQKLKLPRNSLLYMATNYEQYGLTGIDKFYQALGQAEFEANFSMPAYYFQGNTVKHAIPEFDKKDEDGKYTDLLRWAVDKDGKSIIQSEFYKHLRKVGKVRTGRPLPTITVFIDRTRTQKEFSNWISIAQKQWLAENPTVEYFERTVEDVVKNIEDRGYASGIQSPENNLLMRMGFPTGNFDGLVSNSPIAWQISNSRAQAIDNELNLPRGYTKMLFTGSQDISFNSLNNKDKSLLQASSLKLSEKEVDSYFGIINSTVAPGSLDPDYLAENSTDYIVDNPYSDPAVTGSTCPIIYTAKDGFMVNETILPDDSFCYHDKTGRHCFESQDEANRFASAHEGDRITNLYDGMAVKITRAINSSIGSSLGADSVAAGLKRFAETKDTVSIFSDGDLRHLAEKVATPFNETNADRIAVTRDAFKSIAEVPLETLLKLSTRESTDAPLVNYKAKLGSIVAQKVLTSHIFNQFGLNIDPDLFDGGDLYDIFRGDLSSLYRLGAAMIDNSLGLKAGTTRLITTALSPDALKCALATAGGGLLGDVLGLEYFPINKLSLNPNELIKVLGQEKIEETLKLPRGTFRVDDAASDTLDNLIKNMGIINFYAVFKMPIDFADTTIKEQYQLSIRWILGDERYSRVEKSSYQYQIQAVRTYLSSALKLDAKANTARLTLERLLRDQFNADDNGMKALLASTEPGQNALQSTGNDEDNNAIRWNQQVTDFYSQLSTIDNSLGLAKTSTYLLLSGRTTPTDYTELVGEAFGSNIALKEIGQLLGLDEDETAAVVNLATNIKSVFDCSGGGKRLANGRCVVGSSSSQSAGEPFHNWGFLYDNLDNIFHFKLDRAAGLPVGTFERILDQPSHTFPIFLEIGAQKLDAQLKIDSSQTYSFTGFYQAMLPEESGALASTCKATVYQNGEDVILDNQIAAALVDLRRAETEEAKEAAEFSLDSLTTARNRLSAGYNDCILQQKKSLPDYTGRAWEFAQQAGAEYLRDKITDITLPGCAGSDCNVGIDMPVNDIRNAFRGDLRYFFAAMSAIGANVVIIEADNISTQNCNPDTNFGGGCEKAVPAGMRITYDEIKMAFFGVPTEQSIVVANWNEATALGSTTYAPDPDSHSFAEGGCEDGSFSNGVMCLAKADQVNDPIRNVDETLKYEYGYTPANLATEIARTEGQIAGLRAKAAEFCKPQEGTESHGQCVETYLTDLNLGNPNNIFMLEHRLELLNNPGKYNVANNPFAAEIQAKAKDIAREKLKYDMLDIALWKLDENVFPGFAQIMMNGNTGERWQSLSVYVRNGLVNGHLFGINFEAIDADLVDAAASAAAYFSADSDAGRDLAMATFTSQKFDRLTEWVSDRTDGLLGFKLNKEMTEGILIGAFKGNWGTDSLSLDGIFGDTVNTENFAGKDRSTLGGAVLDFGLGKIFAWGDKALGLSAGQSLGLFTGGRDVYHAVKAYKAAEGALKAAKEGLESIRIAGESLQSSEDAAAFGEQMTEAQEAVKSAEESASAAYEGMRDASGVVVKLAISIMVDKILGKTLAGIEEQLGIVPGSLAPLISTAIYAALLPVMNAGIQAVFGVAGFLPALGPWGIALAVGMFLVSNLFGVYRVEYWCSADGYYPGIGQADPYKNDISELGEGGGRLNGSLDSIIKEFSIKAAQYKAQRLIADALEIEYNENFNDSNDFPTIPTQIMTGRKEDVEAYEANVLFNICQLRLGKNAKLIFNGTAAVCEGGLNRMGLWQNPQTVAWTHIGF